MRTYLDLRPPQAPRFFPKIIKKKLKKIKKKLKFYPKFYFIFLIFAPPKLFFFQFGPPTWGAGSAPDSTGSKSKDQTYTP
jgi:hypothetical protein